ncbi:MAG: hypothetical protein LBM92_07240, partial [Opitutaceae bacterium]|nr:hypothetical protein [Opitutaceae bacterium]
MEISDAINSPVYHWPRTLVSYDVDFDGTAVRPGDLQLTEKQSGRDIPAQFTDVVARKDGTISRARLNFFCDLQPGAKHVFELARGKGGNIKAGEDGRVTASIAGNVTEVSTGRMAVRIPRSGDFSPGAAVPAPVMALKHKGGWMGDNRIIPGAREVLRLDVEPVSTGDLLHVYKLAYHFSGGASYIVSMRIIAGYDFIEYDEEMSGFAEDDNARVEMRWGGFAPTHRHAAWSLPEAPGVFGIRAGRWLGLTEQLFTVDVEEDPKWFQPHLEEDVSREMAFRLNA